MTIPLHRAELCLDCEAISDGSPCSSCGGRGTYPLRALIDRTQSGDLELSTKETMMKEKAEPEQQ